MKPKNLLVAATSAEIVDICGQIQPYQLTDINDKWSVLITGVGIAPTVFHLTKVLSSNDFGLILNVGLAGAINPSLSIGEVVNVISEEFALFGSEDNGGFLSVFELGLQNSNEFPFSNGKILPIKSGFNLPVLQKVSGITSQTVTGTATTIDLIKKYYDVDVETMEGAAVFYVANQFNVPAIQIRAISNYVEPRNRANWKISEALNALKLIVSPCLKSK